MKQEEIDLYNVIQRLLGQWKLLIILNVFVFVFAIAYLNMFVASYKSKMNFEINPSFNSDVSSQILLSLKTYAEVEPDDFKEKYKSIIYNYDDFSLLAKSIYEISDDQILSIYNKLNIDEDKFDNQFIEFTSDNLSYLNNELVLKLHENANTGVQDWVLNVLNDVKQSFENELENKKEVHSLLIDRNILEANLKLERQIILYLSSMKMALNELNAARETASSLGYTDPANEELYTMFSSKNLNVPTRFKDTEKLTIFNVPGVEPDTTFFETTSYSLPNISGIPLFLFGTKLIDSEINMLLAEKDNIDNLFPNIRAEIKLLENKKSLIFVDEIEEELIAIKSLDSVIIKLEKFIEDTNYDFIYANKNRILNSSEYPNLFMSLILIFSAFLISIILALYNSERVLRNKL
tara:strand:+ start:2038 stop:3258 length:1221 start_codon:yes stop_codon:yes gene_type:complete